MLQRQVARTRALQAGRSNDVNTLPDPRTYAAVMGLMGTAPDEMGFSALHPDLAGIKQAAEPAYALGTAAAMAPIMQALAQSRIARQALMSGGKAIAPQIEQYMAKQGMILPLDVYHGTPHRFAPTANNPLGEFKSSQIGTGEGNQAFEILVA